MDDIRLILRDMGTPLAGEAAAKIDALLLTLEGIREYPYIVGGEKSAPEMAALAARAIHDYFYTRPSEEAPMIDLTPTQKAYSLLWQEISDRPRVHQARRILLAAMTKDEQRAAIAWVKQHAPITEREILENCP